MCTLHSAIYGNQGATTLCCELFIVVPSCKGVTLHWFDRAGWLAYVPWFLGAVGVVSQVSKFSRGVMLAKFSREEGYVLQTLFSKPSQVMMRGCRTHSVSALLLVDTCCCFFRYRMHTKSVQRLFLNPWLQTESEKDTSSYIITLICSAPFGNCVWPRKSNRLTNVKETGRQSERHSVQRKLFKLGKYPSKHCNGIRETNES